MAPSSAPTDHFAEILVVPVAVSANKRHHLKQQAAIWRQRGGCDHLSDDQDIAGACDWAADQAGLIHQATEVANFLKAMGHDGRLTILCHLRTGPKSVTELENLLASRQAVVSQQLARLRLEGMVSARREGQAIFYSLLDPKVTALIEVLARLFPKAE